MSLLKRHINLIISVGGLALIIFVFIDYDNWVDPKNQSFSYKSKLFKLIFLTLDDIGGKTLVIIILLAIELIYIYHAIDEFKK